MNIYRREMKAHRWGLLFWSIGMVLLVMSGMAKFAAYEQAGQSVTEIMGALPKAVQVLFGLTGFDLTKASGFYGILFLYIAVMAAVHAVILGTGVIAEEERDKTSEFLYTKPVSRATALTGKLLAGVTNLVVLNLVTLGSSIAFVNYYGNGESFTSEILVLMVGLLLLQLIFFAVGTVMAGASHKPRAAGTRAMSIMLFSFVLYYLVNLNGNLDWLKYFTPFKYYDAAVLMKEGLDPVFVVLSLAIIVLGIVGTYYAFRRRDLAV
jgi:ABC-2 type transport system permease protein